jgi:hypothetical protein
LSSDVTLEAPQVSLVALLLPLAIGVLAGLALRSRPPSGARDPAAYFYLTMSLIFLAVGITAAGVGTYAVAQLVGPQPAGTHWAGCFGFSCTTFAPSVIGNGGTAFYSVAYKPHDVAIAVAVGAGLFLFVALAGYLITWPRTRRVDDGILASYRYLVAGLAAITLLIVVPLTAYGVFQAVDPTVAGLRGHAPGVRNLIALVVVSALVGAVLRYHLTMGSAKSSEPDH